MQVYSFADITLLVQGIEITGFDEGDDVINLERFKRFSYTYYWG